MTINITNLATEILLHIFKYCDAYDIFRLLMCCKRFKNVLTENDFILKHHQPVVTNQVDQIILKRSKVILNTFEKWRVSHNWKIGRYETHVHRINHRLNMPWLYLEKDRVWVTEENIMYCYNRTPETLIDSAKPIIKIRSFMNAILTKFVVKDDIVIMGTRNGAVFWATKLDRYEKCHHNADVVCIDAGKNITISGSHDGSFIMWKYYSNKDLKQRPHMLHRERLYERVCSVKISPAEKNFAIGLSGINRIPLNVYDLERCVPTSTLFRSSLFGKFSGILDIHWEDENTLLTCGHSSYVHKWDIRTGCCVQRWEEPHDSSVYCLASDNCNTIFGGTNYHGKVVLWDQRKIDHVQFYFTCKTNNSSPVYSLSFDSTELFAALDRSLTVLDFSGRNGKIRNYNDMFSVIIRI